MSKQKHLRSHGIPDYIKVYTVSSCLSIAFIYDTHGAVVLILSVFFN